MFYLVKSPTWLKKLYPSYVWHVKTTDKVLYLTFDDGPHPEATPFVLSELKKKEALATFFCIGQNVVQYPDVYKQILDEGHTTGNHTHTHPNGWQVKNEIYLRDVLEASRHIHSALFRPPYGKITSFQAKHLPAAMGGRKVKIIMWDIVSADFDEKVSPEQCLQHVIFSARPGSIVIFHDSEKAFPKLRYALPKVLQFFAEKGYRFESVK